MFNIYTNDQPISTDSNVKHYIYADDTAITVQHDQFENVEEKLSPTLDILGKYYRRNYLKPNPSKTQVCAFHLRNRCANRILNVYWDETKITNTQCPKYLGITLDRSLTYRFHCENTKHKIITRNGILRKLSGSTWDCNPHVLRTTALALCFSAVEYASPVWGRSSHTKKVDVALNESCRLITGCLKNTPVEQLYILSGIASPPIRRSTQADWERTKITADPRHPIYGITPQLPRLKSRKSFMNHTKAISSTHPEVERTTRWRNEISMYNLNLKILFTMNNPKKRFESGASKRKRKAEEERKSKLLPSVSKFFTKNLEIEKTSPSNSFSSNDIQDMPSSPSPSSPINIIPHEMPSSPPSFSVSAIAHETLSSFSPSLSTNEILEKSPYNSSSFSPNGNIPNLDFFTKLLALPNPTDIGHFNHLTLSDELKKFIVEYGSCQPKGPFYRYSDSLNNRVSNLTFNGKYYSGSSVPGGKKMRLWLCYSIILQVAYCQPCTLFGN
ncbi:hypothetical protein QTP88_020887 [Uroleucon formosanum]